MSESLSTAARHSSESNEHYTPDFIVDAARKTLGCIDLDPASCEEANRVVRANSFFSHSDNGFRREWHGRVFLNPPGGRSDNQERPVLNKCRETGECGLPVGHTHDGVESSQKKWWFKLAREWREGRVQSAIFVCFSVELLQSSQVNTPDGLRVPLDFPICFPKNRVPYVKPGGEVGKQPPHASCIVFLPGGDIDTRAFWSAFENIGRCIGVS